MSRYTIVLLLIISVLASLVGCGQTIEEQMDQGMENAKVYLTPNLRKVQSKPIKSISIYLQILQKKLHQMIPILFYLKMKMHLFYLLILMKVMIVKDFIKL